MSEKRYCFIPESHKTISIYNANVINDLRNLAAITPTFTFKYSIDDYDKIRMFFLEGHGGSEEVETQDYFNYHIVNRIKTIFKISEINDYRLFLEDGARVEFTVYYDPDGNHIPNHKLVEKNRFNTVLAHRYTYIFYRRYDA